MQVEMKALTCFTDRAVGRIREGNTFKVEQGRGREMANNGIAVHVAGGDGVPLARGRAGGRTGAAAAPSSSPAAPAPLQAASMPPATMPPMDASSSSPSTIPGVSAPGRRRSTRRTGRGGKTTLTPLLPADSPD